MSTKPKAKKRRRGEPSPAEIAHAEPPASPVEAEAATLAAQSSTIRRWARHETVEQERFVEDLMTNRADYRTIARMGRARWPEFTIRRARFLQERVRGYWREEAAASREENREAARRRIYRRLVQASGERNQDDTWRIPPDHQAIARYEALLAKMEGTFAPVKVEVQQTFTAAMLSVISQLDGEDGEELLEEASRMHRLAALAEESLPAALIDMEVRTDPDGIRRGIGKAMKKTDKYQEILERASAARAELVRATTISEYATKAQKEAHDAWCRATDEDRAARLAFEEFVGDRKNHR